MRGGGGGSGSEAAREQAGFSSGLTHDGNEPYSQRVTPNSPNRNQSI